MNQIRAIQKLNQQELDQNIPFSASWHQDFAHTAYIYFGGLPYELTEGDILTVFSQYGIPVDLKLARDPETGDSKGFGWLKYEDQRSTVLAVDNFNGSKVAGRTIRVDHCFYEPSKDKDGTFKEYKEAMERELAKDLVSEDRRIKATGEEIDDEFADPMAKYLK